MPHTADPCAPVGLFDSGLGGLTVLREVVSLLPCEDTFFYADRAHCPYGHRPADEVVALSDACVRRLLAERCKLVVVACNTATAAAIATLRSRYPEIPFVGMEPAVKPAAQRSRTHVVGVLATQGTASGRHFRETSAKWAAGTRVVVRDATDLVALVEAGMAGTGEARAAVAAHVNPLLEAGADCIVLGCTHFPHLREDIRSVAGPGVELFDPSPAVARRVKSVLDSLGLLHPPPHAGVHRRESSGKDIP